MPLSHPTPPSPALTLDMSLEPSFPGQYSVEKERSERRAILDRLHRYAHGTGALAGEDVVLWFKAQLDAHTARAPAHDHEDQPQKLGDVAADAVARLAGGVDAP
jgi:hypothetical protein